MDEVFELKRWLVQWVYGTTCAGLTFGLLYVWWPMAWYWHDYAMMRVGWLCVAAIGAGWATIDYLGHRHQRLRRARP